MSAKKQIHKIKGVDLKKFHEALVNNLAEDK